MKAPDKVWENLSKHLNKERRRFGAGLSAFLLFTGLLGYLTISTSTKQNFVASLPRTQPTQTSAPASNSVRTAATKNRRAVPQTLVVPRANLNISANKYPRLKTTVDVHRISAFGSSTRPSTETEKSEAAAGNRFTPTVVDNNPDPTNNAFAPNAQAIKPAFLLSHNAAPWSIESVWNAYKPRKRRFQTQYYFAPTISYRKLSENKSYLRTTSLFNSPPNYAALYGSVNKMVTHKPDLGFELGVTEKYALSKKVKLRAGLQFNVNRYDIKAFNAPYSLTTIALNNRASSRVDSVWALSNYSNVAVGGKKINWLQNFSFQVSAPIGVELALAGNDKVQFGIATAVQPTYVLGDRAYQITTNYKNYTQIPWLLRRWNVNTSFETFVAYQSGRTRWQIGPQVRYQLVSSFISDYPVKEYLFDFGLKIGLSVIK